MRGSRQALAAIAALMRFSTSIVQAATPLILALAGIKLLNVSVLTVSLWAGSAAGSLMAVALRGPRRASVLGLFLMGAATLSMFLDPMTAFVSVPLAGVGAGLASSILPPLLHMMSPSDRPFEGVASYSTSLSIGLVAAMAFTSLASLKSIPLAFLASSVVSFFLGATLSFSRVEVPNVKVELPGPSYIYRLLRKRTFTLPFTSNAAYSIVLPLVISYWSLYSLKVIGLNPSMSFALLSAMFLASGTIRALSMRLTSVKEAYITAEALLVLAMALLLTGQRWLAIAGLLLFSVPHSLIYPATLYQALSSDEDPVRANYVFSASSGGGEVLSPIIAAIVIDRLGIGYIYGAGLAFSALSTLPALLLMTCQDKSNYSPTAGIRGDRLGA